MTPIELSQILSMTAAERELIMDTGIYNESIKGYLVAAMQAAEFSREEISKALRGLNFALDDLTACDAADVYWKF